MNETGHNILARQDPGPVLPDYAIAHHDIATARINIGAFHVATDEYIANRFDTEPGPNIFLDKD